MPLLDANRRALAGRFPEVLAALERAASAAGIGSTTPGGDPAWVEQTAIESRQLLVLSGLPSAEVLRAIFARTGRESLVWCLEPDAAALGQRLASEPLAAWLLEPRLFISIGVPSENEVRRLNREFAWFDNARAVPYPPVHRGDTARWTPLFTATLARLRLRWKQVFTDVKLAPVRVENTTANLARFLASPSLESLAGAFHGVPMIVVAAGPSLDDAHEFLRAAHSRALVVTGNTSFRSLASRDLAPHLSVSIDPFPTTDLGYVDQPLAATHLVAPAFAFPKVIERFSGRLFGLADQSLLLNRLRTAAGLPPPPALLGEGTVSATALNLAAYLGCSEVFFVGQDLALGEDGRTHAVDTFYTDQGWNENVDRELHSLPGTSRPSVTSTGLHLWYLRVIESLIARHSTLRYWNTSSRGAAIKGAPFLSYADAAARLATLPARNFAAELAARHETARSAGVPASITAELSRAQAGVAEGARLALATALAGEVAAANPSSSGTARFGEFAQRFEKWRVAQTADASLLSDGATKSAVLQAEKAKVRLPATTPNRPLREALEIAWAFADGGHFMHQRLSQAG